MNSSQLPRELGWVEKLPQRYRVARLGSVANPVKQRNIGNRNTDLLSLSYGNIISKDIESVDGLLPESFETYNTVEPGDVVFRLTDLQNDKRSLRTGLVKQSGIITSAYVSVRPVAIEARYLAYFMRAMDLAKVFYSLGGGLRQSLNYAEAKLLPVVLPPEGEQRAIADYLDRETAEIDAFISDLQVVLLLANEHFSSLRSEVLRQPSSVEKKIGSPSVPLTRALPCRVDYRGATPTKVDEGIQLVTARNIRPGWIDYESSQEFVSSGDYSQVMSRGLPSIGDILFTMEAPLGNAALVDRTDVALAQRVIKFTPAPGVDSSFMCHVMNSDEFQNQLRELATGSTALGLKASKLHQLQVLIPDTATQERVVRTLDEAWSSVVDLQYLVDEATKLASERREALISAAVTGQIDVTARGLSAAEKLRDELEVHV